MPFFIELLDVLHKPTCRCPTPAHRDGNGLRELCGKPALLQPRLSGKHIKAPNNQHCAQVGELLAHIHLATREHIIERRTDRGLDWMLASGAELLPGLSPEQAQLLQPALDEITAHKAQILALPKANLHADLFRDNVMFEGTHLTGVIDFYNACSGPMLYDIAITVNDWCLDEHSGLDLPRAQALLGPMRRCGRSPQPKPSCGRAAALCVRFWLSRLIAAQAFAGMDVMIHDPREFEVRLAQRQQVALKLPFAL
jgi:homoserine kinase type II